MAKSTYQLTRQYVDLTDQEKEYIKAKGYSTMARFTGVSLETLRRSCVHDAHMNVKTYNKIFNGSIETKIPDK